jgi:hypothetical protein
MVGCQRLVNGTRQLLVGVAQNQPRHRAGRLLVQAGQHVAIGVHGDRDVGVAKALADHLGWDASGQRGGRIAVADVVQPDLGQAGRMGVLLEPSGEALRVDGAAIRPGEYQARLLPAWANRQPLLELPGAVLTERGDRCRVQRQGPAALLGLGLGDDDLIVDDHPRPARCGRPPAAAVLGRQTIGLVGHNV